MSARLISFGAINAFIAVAAGAFAAHGLKNSLTVENINIFHTASDYHFGHALGLLLIGLLYKVEAKKQLLSCGYIMQIGIVLFCGSLYLLALTNIKWLGMITPLGGLCFLFSWLYLAVVYFKE